MARADYRTCRFCGRVGLKIKYSVRAYACTACLVRARGIDFVCTLPPGELGELRVNELSADDLALVERALRRARGVE